MFYFTYVLLSLKDKQFYSGFTTDLDNRTRRHSDGEVPSTKYRRPLVLIFYEAYLNKSDALRREKYFKTTKGKTTLRTMLREYLNDNLKSANYTNKTGEIVKIGTKSKILKR
jgi:putative endonuclease